MCFGGGGGGREVFKPPTPPERIPELVLDERADKAKQLADKRSRLRRGRGSLVSPGLAIGGGGGAPRLS